MPYFFMDVRHRLDGCLPGIHADLLHRGFYAMLLLPLPIRTLSPSLDDLPKIAFHLITLTTCYVGRTMKAVQGHNYFLLSDIFCSVPLLLF